MDTSLINKIQKARDYAMEPERITFHTLTIEFQGDNNIYTLALGADGWSCTCPGFQKYGICPHVMAVEKLFKPMLKRDPLPYAPGQNIVSDVKKAHRYSMEPERMRFISFDVTFRGDNKDHEVTYDHGTWHSTSSYFQSHGICPYTMALERIFKGMVEPIMLVREAEVE
jgi:hypothetical protein